MNRKADLDMRLLLGALVFAALLYLIFFGPLKQVFIDFAKPFIDNAPGFKESNVSAAKIGITRYDIMADKVEIYDGERWNEFGQNIKFESMSSTVSEGDVNDAFESYYFSKDLRPDRNIYAQGSVKGTVLSISTSASTQAQADHFWEVPGASFANWWTSFDHPEYPRGTVFVSIWKDNQAYGFALVRPDNSLAFEGTEINDNNPIDAAGQQQLSANTIIWRDSIFSKPSINIQGNNFCLQKHGDSYIQENRYLIVDLTKVGASC